MIIYGSDTPGYEPTLAHILSTNPLGKDSVTLIAPPYSVRIIERLGFWFDFATWIALLSAKWALILANGILNIAEAVGYALAMGAFLVAASDPSVSIDAAFMGLFFAAIAAMASLMDMIIVQPLLNFYIII